MYYYICIVFLANFHIQPPVTSAELNQIPNFPFGENL